MPLLPPDDVLRQMEIREAALVEQLAAIEDELRSLDGVLPRLFLLEEELMRATLVAELQWVRSLIDDLRSERTHLEHGLAEPVRAARNRRSDSDEEEL